MRDRLPRASKPAPYGLVVVELPNRTAKQRAAVLDELVNAGLITLCLNAYGDVDQVILMSGD